MIAQGIFNGGVPAIPSLGDLTGAVRARQLRELSVFAAIAAVISCILWWRFLPLPHQDLNFYTEPAYLLAEFGKLAGPGSQYMDLTYRKGMYSYPPGYFIILAGWLKLFGLSPDSLLGFTHLIHFGALVLLWMLLRFRYACSRFISVLVLVAFFPRMVHGRPDLTAAFLSLAAWAALPEELNWPRIVLSGCLGGATLWVSPGFGLAIISSLAILILLNAGQSFRLRLCVTAAWLLSAGLLFGGATATFLTLQHSWLIAYAQFKTNVTIRGTQLNVMPELRLLFTWVFAIVPFLFIAILPAILVVGWHWRKATSNLRNVGLAFLGGMAVWFASNKSQLLLDHHYLSPSKSIFLGMGYSWPRLQTWARVMPLLLLSLINFYYHKADYLYLGTPLRQDEHKATAQVKPEGIVAVDSLYFARFYRPGQTLNYEVTEIASSWTRYREAIPGFARNEMLTGLPDGPMEPTVLIVSAATRSRFREKEQFHLSCKQSDSFARRLHILGRTWNLPAEPFALEICGK